MAQSAKQGTGAEVDRALPFPDALVKTGTAMCTHANRAPGDGFTIAMSPSDDPQILLMVRAQDVRVGVLGLFRPHQFALSPLAGSALVVHVGAESVVLEASSGVNIAHIS